MLPEQKLAHLPPALKNQERLAPSAKSSCLRPEVDTCHVAVNNDCDAKLVAYIKTDGTLPLGTAEGMRNENEPPAVSRWDSSGA